MTIARAERVSRIIGQVRAKKCTDPHQDAIIRDLHRSFLLGQWDRFDLLAEALETMTRAGAN